MDPIHDVYIPTSILTTYKSKELSPPVQFIDEDLLLVFRVESDEEGGTWPSNQREQCIETWTFVFLPWDKLKLQSW